MHLITLFIDGEKKEIPFPSDWNELTQSELRYCISAQGGEHSQPKIFCFLILTSAMRNKITLPEGWQSRLNQEEAAIASIDCLAFLYDENNLTNSPFKKLKVDNILLHGPADAFQDLKVAQMELAHPALERYRTTGDLNHLYDLCSFLFRRGKADVTEASAKALLPIIKKIQPDILLCMYTWFSGCLRMLPLHFEHLYDTSETNQPAEFDYMGFTTMIHGAAGGRNGNRPEIRATKLMEFLFDLNMLAEEAKKQEKADAANN